MPKNELKPIKNAGLKKPGDNMSARITKTNRQVVKINTPNEKIEKESAVRYPSTGRIVKTTVYKPE